MVQVRYAAQVPFVMLAYRAGFRSHSLHGTGIVLCALLSILLLAGAGDSDIFRERFHGTTTILDLDCDGTVARVIIPEDSLELYQEWIREAVDLSREVDYAIVISKLDGKLWLYNDGQLEREIDNVVVGPNPIDAKEVLGDGCTPEGFFYACTKNPRSRFYKSIQISYPDTIAARRALRQGVISEFVYRQIATALVKKVRPPMHTEMGGDICIHGRRVSEGCMGIGMDNMDYIFPRVRVSYTPICIVRGTRREYLVPQDVMERVRMSRLFKRRHWNWDDR